MTAYTLPIPVTLLTGFLGSGKTTLLNHLIRDPEMGRVAVIINEFGDVGLDHDLIEEATEEMVLLQSGCLCCTIRGDLVTAMLALLRRQAAGEVAFDRVVIETTGLADPAPILHTLLIEQQLAQAFRLDGVVTTACAATGPRSLDLQFEAVNQIALADRIVLTKTDLVTPPELRRFEDRLAQINPGAARITADIGHVPPGVLFGISGMQTEAEPEKTLRGLTLQLIPQPSPQRPPCLWAAATRLTGFLRRTPPPTLSPACQWAFTGLRQMHPSAHMMPVSTRSRLPSTILSLPISSTAGLTR
jgi:G3E family GTPase